MCHDAVKNYKYNAFYFSVAVNKVATYKELDSDLQRTAQFSMLVSKLYVFLSQCYET